MPRYSRALHNPCHDVSKSRWDNPTNVSLTAAVDSQFPVNGPLQLNRAISVDSFPKIQQSLWAITPNYREWVDKSARAPKIVERRDLLRRQAGIPSSALRNNLFTFTTSERESWGRDREMEHEQDSAYLLLGVSDVHLQLFY
jgi:hypothetical protein